MARLEGPRLRFRSLGIHAERALRATPASATLKGTDRAGSPLRGIAKAFFSPGQSSG
jgi:hypothetical protein